MVVETAIQAASDEECLKDDILISIHRRRKEKTKFQTLRYWLDNHLPAAWDQARVSSLRNGYSFNNSPYVHPKAFQLVGVGPVTGRR